MMPNQPLVAGTGNLDSFASSLFGMDASEKQQVAFRPVPKFKLVKFDAVMDGCLIIQARGPIRITNRNVVRLLIILLIDWQNCG